MTARPATDWPAPLDDPLSYPGEIPDHSFLLLSGLVHPLEEQPGRRLGFAKVTHLDSLSLRGEWQYLDQLLYHKGAASMDSRIPVLAYGSNQNPSQLHRKFTGNCSTTVPVTRVRTKGIRAAFLASVSYYGAVPVSIAKAHSPIWEESFSVTWLDPEQFSVMRGSEPGYSIHQFTRSDSEHLIFANGERNLPILAYVADSAFLHSTGGLLWLDRSRSLREMQSDALLAVASGDSTHRSMPPQWKKEAEPTESPQYRDLYDPGSRPSDAALRVTASTDAALHSGRPRGRPTIYVHADHKMSSGLAVVRAVMPCGCVGTSGQLPSFTAQVVRGTAGDIAEDQVGLDISIRFALGLAINEWVTVEPASARRDLSDRVIPTSWVVGRVVTSDGRVVERSQVLVEPLTVRLLGIDEGDPVWIQSTAADGTRRRIRANAHQIPDALADLRESASWGNASALFPDCGRLFGGETDLSCVYVDAEDRRRLGVDKCDPVQVSAVRIPQFAKAFRELALLLVVAAVGVVGIWPQHAGWVLCLTLLISLLLTYLSVRSRLHSHR